MRGILSPTRVLTTGVLIFLIWLFSSHWEGSSMGLAGPPMIKSPPVEPFGGRSRPLATTPHPDEEAGRVIHLGPGAQDNPQAQSPVETVPEGPPESKPESQPVPESVPELESKPEPVPPTNAENKPEPPLAPKPASKEEKDLKVAIVTFITQEKSYVQTSMKNKQAYANKHNYTLIVDYDAPEPRGVMWYKMTMIEKAILGGGFDWVWWIDFDTLMMTQNRPVTDVIKEELEKVEESKRDDIDFLLTPDCFPLNAGSMLVRATPRAIPFFNLIRAYSDLHEERSEQDCIRDAVFGYPAPEPAAVLEFASWHPAQKSDHENRTDTPAFLHQDPAYPDHLAENAAQFEKLGETEWRYPSGKRVRFIPQKQANAFPDEIKCFERGLGPWEEGDLLIHFAGAWAHLKEEDPTGLLMRQYDQLVKW